MKKKTGFTLLFFVGLFLFLGSMTQIYADETDVAGGIYDGVPWRITSDYELLIGEDGEEYTFDYQRTRYDDAYPWLEYSKKLISARVLGTVNGNGSMQSMFYHCSKLQSIDSFYLNQNDPSQILLDLQVD